MRRALIVAMMILAHAIGAASAAHGITEDSPGWNCRTMGNHLCGRSGVLHVQGSPIDLY